MYVAAAASEDLADLVYGVAEAGEFDYGDVFAGVVFLFVPAVFWGCGSGVFLAGFTVDAAVCASVESAGGYFKIRFVFTRLRCFRLVCSRGLFRGLGRFLFLLGRLRGFCCILVLFPRSL